jgi:acetolactate synthase-1/3 small subunit
MAHTSNERRVISVIVMNESSVLSRVTSMFAARGYNIESLTVAPIPESDMSHMTIETRGNARVMEQITKQLHKLIPVYKVIEHEEMVEKEMVLAKFPIGENLSDIAALAGAYNGVSSTSSKRHSATTLARSYAAAWWPSSVDATGVASATLPYLKDPCVETPTIQRIPNDLQTLPHRQRA